MDTQEIAFICQSASHHKYRPFGQGGTDSQIYGLASALSSKGHEVSIIGKFIGPDWKDPSVDDKNLKFINIRALSLPDTRIGNLFSGLLLSKTIAHEIGENTPDLIVISAPFTGYFLTKFGVTTIYVTHNPNGMDFFKQFSRENHILNSIAFPIWKRLEENIIQQTDATIALNQYIKNYLQRKGFTNIHHIPNAVDLSLYSSRPDRNYILFAGGFRRVKGIEFLISAFLKIANTHDTDLLLIGSGKEEERFKKIVFFQNLEGRVHFIPLVDKVTLRQYLAECSVFVLPSLFETFGVTLLEAMASGRAVIASDIPGPQDIITHGHDGFLFEKENVEQLVEYLDLCLSNQSLMERLGKNARRTIEQKYTFNTIAQKYLEVYDNIIRK
jgi:glycosyltransferase involved in cell wall biosynthesis